MCESSREDLVHLDMLLEQVDQQVEYIRMRQSYDPDHECCPEANLADDRYRIQASHYVSLLHGGKNASTPD